MYLVKNVCIFHFVTRIKITLIGLETLKISYNFSDQTIRVRRKLKNAQECLRFFLTDPIFGVFFMNKVQSFFIVCQTSHCPLPIFQISLILLFSLDIHFQYNGFLFSFLLLSITDMLQVKLQIIILLSHSFVVSYFSHWIFSEQRGHKLCLFQ